MANRFPKYNSKAEYDAEKDSLPVPYVATYQCNALHWHIQCSNIYSSKVVYSTKYATPDADFVSVDTPNNSAPPTTIEITVTSEKGGSRYVHVAIENVYGRAYYYVTKK